MGHILGMHWQRVHPDNKVDFAHIRAMHYRSYTLFGGMWDDKDFCRMLVENADKDAIFLLRDHPLSEEKAGTISDPAGFGTAHGISWGKKWEQGLIALPVERCYMLGINELDTNQYQMQNDVYTDALAKSLANFSLKCAGWSFGVGHPSTKNLDPKEKPDWSWYRKSADTLMRLDGIAAVHEYWVRGSLGWGFWTGRFALHCPYDLQAVVKETWIDSGVIGVVPNRGYRDYWKPEEYTQALDELDNYQHEMAKTQRIHSVQPFTYDSNDDWTTFDIRPVAKLMEMRRWQEHERVGGFVVTHLPAVYGGEQRLVHPIAGPLDRTQRFGENPQDYEKYGIPGHNGVDYAARQGTPVLAIADGEVQWVGFDQAYGNYVRVWHKQFGFHSFYAHLDGYRDGLKGRTVRRGDVLGTVGSTGNSTGPHLHLEIRLGDEDGRYVLGTAGYSKGRVDPETIYHIINRS